jgi:hypothetical protein
LALVEKPESQVFRKLIADHFGMAAAYDYKQFPFEELSLETANDLRKQMLPVHASA